MSALKGKAPTQQQMVARHILAHPVIAAMTKGASRPSYVPRERFVSALLERGGQTRAKRLRLASGEDATARTHALIQALPRRAEEGACRDVD